MPAQTDEGQGSRSGHTCGHRDPARAEAPLPTPTPPFLTRDLILTLEGDFLT